jgi:hypothetical protein
MDIQYWDDSLMEEIEDIQLLLDQVLSTGEGQEKSAMFERVEKRLRAAQGTKRSFKMETRLIADVNQRKIFENRLQRLDQQLMTLQAECKALKQEHERGELFEEGGAVGREINEEDAQKAGDKMLAEASKLQRQTQDSLGNTKSLIAQSKEVGMSTLEELERQRDVLSNIEKEIDRVDDNLARAANGRVGRRSFFRSSNKETGHKKAAAPCDTVPNNARALKEVDTPRPLAVVETPVASSKPASTAELGAPEHDNGLLLSDTEPQAGSHHSTPTTLLMETEAVEIEQRSDNGALAPEEESLSVLTSSGLPNTDLTQIQKQLDSKFQQHDVDDSLRATIVKASNHKWFRTHAKNLLSKAESSVLSVPDIKTGKDTAFDLCDILSRGGSMPLPYSELHVVVAVTHCFENDILDTVVQDNVNPVEKVEKSAFLLASTIHGDPPCEHLIRGADHLARLQTSFPGLFDCFCE